MSDLTVTSLSPPVAPAAPEVVAPARPRWVFWLGAAFVTLVGAVLRLVGLDRPPELVFDEAYHAAQGRELFRHGVEWDSDRGTAMFAADPPLGRWLIGVGEHLFGYNAFGWRIGAATVGTLSILLLVLIAYRLFGSGLLACAAGLLMAMDGLHFVLSRTAMLDIFAMFFVLAGFGCVVLNRERPPGRTVPWWLLGAGLCFGLACGVKLSVVWFVPVAAALVVATDVRARRLLPWLLAFFALAAVAYLATWTGWLASDDGYLRHWYAEQHHTSPSGPVDALASLLHYHQKIQQFRGSTPSTPHPYQSTPLQWLLQDRPVVFYWQCPAPCGPASTTSEVLLLGTPILWWSFLPALAVLAWQTMARRDWPAIAIAAFALTAIVPWFWRPAGFLFDALPAEPFLILVVIYALDRIGRRLRPGRPAAGRALVIGGYALAVAVCFAYFYPVFAGTPIPYADWLARMWLHERWI